MPRARAKPADTPDPDEPFDPAASLIAAAERKKEEAAARDEPAPASPAPATTKRKRKARNDAADATPAPAPETVAPRGPGAWTAACVCAALCLLVVTVAAAVQRPEPAPVDDVQVVWLDGPQVSKREVQAWIATFPMLPQLAEANAFLLDKLRDHLAAQPAVAAVPRIELVHNPSGDGKRLGRCIRIVMGLRQPWMPALMATGQRVWVDAEGFVLPGHLKGPTQRRPLLRGIEQGGAHLRAGVEAWQHLEGLLEPGLVTDIHLWDVLDPAGTRGIVLLTRGGSRLVWGRPDEERFGRDTAAKARDLVHTIRCQGDLSRVATINVRFAKPFFTLRDGAGN
jgi:hypothetical protein